MWLQVDYTKRPSANQLLRHAMIEHVKNHALTHSAHLVNPRSCNLPQSMMAPFSPLVWLYDMEEVLSMLALLLLCLLALLAQKYEY